ncbi:MAG: hypothetical protein GF383_08185 [Candidatus Lokiarchaeota archaeon]|nr:hypothetical protein [Candidatus Lokiarchaeota archaeon]MBD3340321.1 hypothetical protein [Candidatus Lokiarchaeota archaeon]
MEQLDCFQVYSLTDGVNFFVDKIWLKEDRLYFRVIEDLQNPSNQFRRESDERVYSIQTHNLCSIRVRLYF